MDLTQREDVIALMKSSKTEKEWNANCNLVKAANRGYPDFWYEAIVLSGVLYETSLKFTKLYP